MHRSTAAPHMNMFCYTYILHDKHDEQDQQDQHDQHDLALFAYETLSLISWTRSTMHRQQRHQPSSALIGSIRVSD